jgi:hypothetical protein
MNINYFHDHSPMRPYEVKLVQTNQMVNRDSSAGYSDLQTLKRRTTIFGLILLLAAMATAAMAVRRPSKPFSSSSFSSVMRLMQRPG